MIRNLTLVLLAPFLWIGTVPQLAAQEVLHETPGYVWPPAQLDQVAWLSGTWRGVNDEGDEVLETWIGPKGQLMAGAFLELTSEEPEVGVVNWAEHMVIVSNGYSLAFHNNTFDPEYSGDQYLERRLLRIEDVAAALEQERGHARSDARLVGTVERQDKGGGWVFCHWLSSP